MPKEYGVVEAEMLLEGGNLVKTWELEVRYHGMKFAFKTQTWSGLWNPLAGCAGSASTSDLEKPTWNDELSHLLIAKVYYGRNTRLVKWGPHLMDQEVGEIFWLQFDILEKDRTKWMIILLKYQIEGYLKIVENFLCQLLFLSVGAKGLGLENESSTWNLSSSVFR